MSPYGAVLIFTVSFFGALYPSARINGQVIFARRKSCGIVKTANSGTENTEFKNTDGNANFAIRKGVIEWKYYFWEQVPGCQPNIAM